MPTFRITEDSTGGTHSGVTDTSIQESVPTENKDGSAYLDIASWGSGNREYIILNFQNPGLGTINLSDAYFGLRSFDGSGETVTLDLFEVVPQIVCPEATWNIRSTGNAWSVPGARGSGSDRGATALASQTFSVQNAYVVWTSAALATYVQTAFNAGASARLLLNYNPDTAYDTHWKRFVSSTGTDLLRPYLQGNYTVVGSTGSGGNPLINALVT